MRAYPILTLVLSANLMLSGAVLAQTKPQPRPTPSHPAAAPGPKAIGKFEDWTAATNIEAGQKACYAFTRAQTSAPALAGRGDVVLTVTERQSGRDAVAISAGFEYSATAGVVVTADQARMDFYTAKRSAFARDGHGAVVAFGRARQASARSPGPKGSEITDIFSLRGFDRAYAAIVKECPAK